MFHEIWLPWDKCRLLLLYCRLQKFKVWTSFLKIWSKIIHFKINTIYWQLHFEWCNFGPTGDYRIEFGYHHTVYHGTIYHETPKSLFLNNQIKRLEILHQIQHFNQTAREKMWCTTVTNLDWHDARDNRHIYTYLTTICNKLEEGFRFEEKLSNDKISTSINLFLQMSKIFIIATTVRMSLRITWKDNSKFNLPSPNRVAGLDVTATLTLQGKSIW